MADSDRSDESGSGTGGRSPQDGSDASRTGGRASEGAGRPESADIGQRLTGLQSGEASLEARLAELESGPPGRPKSPERTGPVNRRSPEREKIALFRSLFRGREDIFPKRWEDVRTGRVGYAPARGNDQAFSALTDAVIEGHLLGRHTVGVYPMLPDDTCWLLAADFDQRSWRQDVEAFRAVCRLKRIPVAVERSRSGDGAHVWIFFAEPVPAVLARRLGTHLLTETMERHPDIGFESYDGFFPSQDTLPAGGFGDFIALPLQHGPRESGNTLFLDDGFNPWPDQWAFLSSLRRLQLSDLSGIAEEAGR